MNNPHNFNSVPMQRLIGRLGRALVIGLGVLLVITVLTALLGYAFTRMFDSAQQWQAWRTDHYWGLLTWRLMLYTVIVFVWLKLKARLPESARWRYRKRLAKIEVLFTLLILLAELSRVLFQPGSAT